MSQVFNKLYLDVRLNNKDIVTEAVQNDTNSRFLDVYLTDNGLPIDLTGHEVRMYGVKGDTTEFYNSGEITEATNGRCQFELTSTALNAAQDIKAQVIIYYNNTQILQTAQFTIRVVSSLISTGAVESSNEYGALVVLFQELYEAKDLMLDMTQNFGEKSTIATERELSTFWQVLEYVSKFLDTNVWNLLNYVLENADVIGVINRLGETADTGGTATAGTVYAKLNALIARDKHKSFKYLETSFGTNQTDVTVLSVTGAGEFYGVYGILSNIKVIIDGVEFDVSGTNSDRVYKASLDGGLAGFNPSPSSFYTYLINSMPFKESLVIKVSSDTTYSADVNVSYSLYE